MIKPDSVPVIVVSPKEDHVTVINSALRDAGHKAHCMKVLEAGDLAAVCERRPPHLVLLVTSSDSPDIAVATRELSGCTPPPPLLVLLQDTVNEDTILRAMQQGARDALSLNNMARLQAVAGRELEVFRLSRSLRQVMQAAHQYRHDLDSLKQISIEAIADIQEGIIVNANPAWLELFGFAAGTDLTGTPIMDLCAAADQSTLKGGLVACQRGKWQQETLAVSGQRPDGSAFPVSFHLENTEFDGEPAVRLLIKPDLLPDAGSTQIIEQAMHCDPVTGLYNQQHFMQEANTRLQRQPDGGIRAILFLRPDRISRAISDLGVFAADSVFAQFAQVLRVAMQKGDLYGRLGGNFFAVMLERGTMADVEAWTGELLKQFANTAFTSDGRSTVLTCSAGLCELDNASPDLQQGLTEAEQACRRARERGGNCYELGESSGAAKSLRQQDSIWIPRIRGALMENRLRLEHQPVAGLNEEIENAYDMLVRMLDEEGNTILPGEFMPAAERTGLTKNIDRWVIGAALSFCVKREAQLVFVRLSRDSLLDDSLVSWLQSSLARIRIAPSRLCLEVDEATVIRHLLQSQELAQALRSLGARFAVEHFGTTAESAQLLNRVPMDFVKIDGSLMQGLHKSPDLQERVRLIAHQARAAKIRTVAERVQDANTMAVLWQLGISYVQGNHLQAREIVIEDTSTTTMTTRALQLAN